MALATFSVAPGFKQTNDQRVARYYFTLALSAPGDTYPVGGIPLKSVLAAALQPTTNSAPLYVQITGGAAGYIYQYIPSTGNLMILQVPPNGSLTTAAPLQQLGSNTNSLSGVFADTITGVAEYLRNA